MGSRHGRASGASLHAGIGASLAGLLVLASGSATPASSPAASVAERVALKAGTIHLVAGGKVLEGGATVLIEGGKIVAAGKDLAVPFGTRVVDYGPSAVITPGLVAAYAPYDWGSSDRGGAAARTADPRVHAIDGFDFYAKRLDALMAGVTTAYFAPPGGRLISGEGAVVKLDGADEASRVLSAKAAIQAAIDSSARGTPGYWEPPLPATVDVGIGHAESQLPRTTMGAIVALNELVALARHPDDAQGEATYGPYTGRELGQLLQAKTPWHVTADTAPEIRALLDFAAQAKIPLVVDDAQDAKPLAAELAKAGVPVIYRVPYSPSNLGQDRGKDRDADWPSYDVATALVGAGVKVAITSEAPGDLLFAAGLATRGGLDHEAALRAITAAPAEILGVADRVGTIEPGKDADLAVYDAAPLSGQAGAIATWVDGRLAWDRAKAGPQGERAAKLHLSGSSVVLHVDELYVGDGRVLRPGEIAIRDGKITEVGERVTLPAGATVVRGAAAMPGIVDALGYLGLEGSRKVPSTDFEMSAIVGPGDRVDRRVAQAGVTTVVLSPRDASSGGAPVMAYKPAATDYDGLVLGDPVALRLEWTDKDRLKSGEQVRDLLAKAKDYQGKWKEYEDALAKWTPPAPAPAPEESADSGEKKDEAESKEPEAEKKEEPKKHKKGEEEPLEDDPLTGLWEAAVARPPRAESSALRLRLHLVPGKGSGDVEGNLRCDAVSDDLVDVKGYWDRDAKELTLHGLGSQGWVESEAKIQEKRLVGTLTVGGNALELSAERKSSDWVVAGRTELQEEKPTEEHEPKGKPREPRRDGKLEPVVAILEGKVTAIVGVDRPDEILDCVEAFESYGVKPVLYGADGYQDVLDQLVGRVKGVLPGAPLVFSEPEIGALRRTPYADIQNAGIPVAFRSEAEEGAIDLPLIAAYAVAHGMSPTGALRALTSDAAKMMSISDRVGLLQPGLDGDVLLLDGPPLAPGSSVLRTWVNGVEVVSE